jgi:arylsulfatase
MADKPNILVIWDDDIGIANLSCYSRGLMGYLYHNYIALAASVIIVPFLETFKEFPPRQKPGSFSLGQALQRMQEVGSGSSH